MSPSIGIKRVAERAGCSIASVSRVINATAPTSAELKARILRAVDELGFTPNELGRSLRLKRTRVLGVVIPSLTNPVFASSVAGIEEAARTRGHAVLLTATDYDLGREPAVVNALLTQRIAGLVITVADAETSPTLSQLDRLGIPYVLIYNQPTRPARAAVTVDNIAAARDLTDRFLACGHRRIAFLAGRFSTSDRSRLRYQGYIEAMSLVGIDPLPVIELDYMADEPQYRRPLEALLASDRAPTALICSNDLLAVSVMGTVRQLGRRVPDDVSVAGFDGIAIGRLICPSLASIELPTRLMGRIAVDRLFSLIDGKRDSTVTILPHVFRPGGSLAAASGQSAGLARSRHHSNRRAAEERCA